MTSEVWVSRYPDLAGKVAVVAGTSSALGEIARLLCDNRAMPALVVDNRALVDSVTQYAEQAGVASIGIVADPADRSTWERIAPHVEQRLGPIDIAVVIGPPALRLLVISALLPDMTARRRGVIVEAGARVEALPVPDGVRHRSVSGGAKLRASDVAAAVVLCASDVLGAAEVGVTLGDSG